MKTLVIGLLFITSISTFAHEIEKTWSCSAKCGYERVNMSSQESIFSILVESTYISGTAKGDGPLNALNQMIKNCQDLGVKGINKANNVEFDTTSFADYAASKVDIFVKTEERHEYQEKMVTADLSSCVQH